MSDSDQPEDDWTSEADERQSPAPAALHAQRPPPANEHAAPAKIVGPGPKLLEPLDRDYPADEVTIIGGTLSDAEDLLPLIGREGPRQEGSSAPGQTTPLPPRGEVPAMMPPRPAASVPRPSARVPTTPGSDSATNSPTRRTTPTLRDAPEAGAPGQAAAPRAPQRTFDDDEATRFYTRAELQPAVNPAVAADPVPQQPQPAVVAAAILDDNADEPTSFYDRSALLAALATENNEEATAFYDRATLAQQLEHEQSRSRAAADADEATRFFTRSSLEEPAEREQLDGPASSPPESVQTLGADEFEELAGDSGSTRFDNEPAQDRLARAGVMQEWRARAEWMETEARAAAEPQAKARALLVASELWAMAGELRRARDVASVAAAIAPSMPLATRQFRWLAAADNADWKTVAASLESETRSGVSADARAHAALLSAELQRVAFSDEAAAQKKIDVALRAAPEDPRAHLAKVVRQLSPDLGPPKYRWPETENFAQLARATRELGELSGASPTKDERTLGTDFHHAARALSDGNRQLAGERIAKLADAPELERAALWLAASLFAVSKETRQRSVELLRKLHRMDSSIAVRRALAARALEHGDTKAVAAAMTGLTHPDTRTAGASQAASEAFSAADRLALSALTGLALEDWAAVAPAEASEELATIARGLRAGAGGSIEGEPAALSLGRAIGGDRSAARERFIASADAYSADRPGDALARVLDLELGRGELSAARIGRALEDAAAERAPEWRLAAALCHELAGDSEAADRAYMAALEAHPASEAAARALCSRADAGRAAELMVGVAHATEDPGHAALLFVEAALRRGADDVDSFDAALEQAVERAPELPFAQRLGEQLARSTGNAPRLLTWLRRRRDASDDDVERALDLIREALLIADDDIVAAAGLLEQASAARPTDVGLRELHERLSGADHRSRGSWRDVLANEVTDPALKRNLWLSAALEYERAADLADAERVARRAAEIGADAYATLVSDRMAASTSTSAARLAERLFSQARSESDALVQRELYERLSRLDESRGEPASALLWHNAILERHPGYLPSLRRLEHAYLGSGREQDLGPAATTLAEALSGTEAAAHAALARRLLTDGDDSERLARVIARAFELDPIPLWAMRDAFTRAFEQGDASALLVAARALASRTPRDLDVASLSLRAGEAALAAGSLDDAREEFERAFRLTPENLVLLVRRAELCARSGDGAAEGRALEDLAAMCRLPEQAVDAWYRAGICYSERAGDPPRAIAALERAAAIDIGYQDVFSRLRAAYVAAGDRIKLAELLQQRLETTSNAEERVLLEVSRGLALAEMGDTASARTALLGALDANPTHVEALSALAELCMIEHDYGGAEDAWIRLSRHVTDPERQADVYQRLGQLYDAELPNANRAELAYREVLKRRPQDAATAEKLVFVYGKLGDKAKAVELMNELANRAVSPAEKRDRTIALARVYEQIAHDRRQAEATLEKARKTWSQDPEVLRATAQFYGRIGETRALGVLLDRSAGEARRALGTGRFEPGFFRTLAVVAELRGNPDAAGVASATVAALQGEAAGVPPIGAIAGHPRFDELVAPELLSLPLRALLRRTGHALDAAYATDARALRAQPLPPSAKELASQVQHLAAALGLPPVEVLVSTTLGWSCMALSSVPPVLLVGDALVGATEQNARQFLLMRTLKIIQARASALSRAPAIELWPMVAAYLSLFAPNWQPQGVDGKKLADMQGRIRAAVVGDVGNDTPVLALEVVGSLGNRASQLGTAVHQWGSRTALLAAGDLGVAFRAHALLTGKSLPNDPSELMKWVARHPEARDLCVFNVSEQYSEARRQADRG